MTIAADCQVIGLTGSFGSGCTTAATTLQPLAFKVVRLSDLIRAEWEVQNPGVPHHRKDLQRLGDEMRAEHGPQVLAERALTDLEALPTVIERIVFDGVRNRGEIQALKRRFGFGFTLVAVLADQNTRWQRLSDTYEAQGFSEAQFLEDDQRDMNEEIASGQEVELCIDASDIIISNNETVTLAAYRTKVKDFAHRALGLTQGHASQPEVFMHLAFSARHSSKCLKRQVGAILVDDRDRVLATGYNENPHGTKPCVEEPAYQDEGPCFRDIVRNTHFASLADANAKCPICGEVFGVVPGPPWRCPVCAVAGIRTNLEQFFFPDRALNWCTAVHAEVAAILTAGNAAAGTTLYTTTFPCFQCAEKIIQAGVRKVVYTEAYPDTMGRARFELAGVELQQFEGVRSSAFERIYGAAAG